MKQTSHSSIKRTRLYVLLSALVFVIAIGAIAYATCSKAMTAERHALSLGGDLVYDSDYHNGCRFIVEMPK